MFRNRIIASCSAMFTCGILAAILKPDDFLIFLTVLFGVSCLFIITLRLFKRRYKTERIILSGLFAVLGFVFTVVYSAMFVSPFVAADSTPVSGSGSVEEINYYSDGGYCNIKVDKCSEKLLIGQSIRLYFSEIPVELGSGDNIDFSTTVYIPANKERLLSHNIKMAGYDAVITFKSPPDSIMAKLRRTFSDYADEMFEKPETASFIKAITIGITDDFDISMMSQMRATGTSHMLSISGQHFSIIIMSFFSLLTVFNVPKKTRSIICFILIIAYSVFVGLDPAIVRSAVMLIAVLSSLFVERESDSVTSLFTALFFLLLFNPFAAVSLSLQLSFLSCLGIVLISPIVNNIFDRKFSIRYRILKFLIPAASYSLVAGIFTFPVLMLTFGNFSVISPLVNIVTGPVFTVLLIFAVLSIVMFPLISGAAVIFYYPATVLYDIFFGMLDFFADMPTTRVSTNMKYMWIPFLIAVLIIAALVIFRTRWRVLISGVLSIVFFLTIFMCKVITDIYFESNVEISVNMSFNSHQLLVASRGETFLIDYGNCKSYSDIAFDNAVDNIDGVVIFKLDDISYYNLNAALSEFNMSKLYIRQPLIMEELPFFKKICDLAKSKKCDIIEFDDSMKIKSGNAVIDFRFEPDGLVFTEISSYSVNMLLFDRNFDAEIYKHLQSDIVALNDSFYNTIIGGDDLFYPYYGETLITNKTNDELINNIILYDKHFDYSPSMKYKIIINENREYTVK